MFKSRFYKLILIESVPRQKKDCKRCKQMRAKDTSSSSCVMFNEEGDNGLMLCGKYLPVEMLMKICYADYKTLVSCQLVCKRWRMLIEESKSFTERK